MIAQLITFQSEQIGLLAAQPNWDAGVKISLDIITGRRIDLGLT